MSASFDYGTTGLPSNPQWMLACDLCHEWLGAHMTMFSPERHLAFMQNQPVAAARRIFDTCDPFTADSITALLLGPAKGTLIETPGAERMARRLFGARVVDLVKCIDAPELLAAADADMQRDVGRIILAEGISTMNDQLIGRSRIDRHHQTRWDILLHLEQQGRILAGRDPQLDALFADALAQSRAALEALDRAANQPSPKAPRQP
jgi:hypothetical protein